MPPGTPGEIQPPAQPVRLESPPTAAIQWQQAWPSVLKAGVIAGLVSFLPLIGIGFFLWVLAGGGWAIYLYRHRSPGTALTGGIGWRLGALTGLVAFAVYAALFAISIAFFGTGPQIRDAVRKALEDAAARSATPQSQQVLDFLLSPGGIATIVTITMAVFLVVFLLSGGIGGAIGASRLRAKQRP